jgi:hypothetical protein
MTFLFKAWLFVRSPLGRYLLGAAAVLALLGGVWAVGDGHGHASEKARQARALAKAQARVAKTDARNVQIVQAIREPAEKTRAVIQWRTRYLTQEVAQHVTPEADRRCIVSRGFVRLYNAAASGLPAVAGAAGGPDNADSGLALSAVAETDVANLGTGAEAINEVKAWREWYAKLSPGR